MRQLVLALCLAALPATSTADEPPPVPEGGINFVVEGKCTDNETGEQGYCYGGYGADGTFYLTFWQNDAMMFIRKVSSGQTYETVWTSSLYMGV